MYSISKNMEGELQIDNVKLNIYSIYSISDLCDLFLLKTDLLEFNSICMSQKASELMDVFLSLLLYPLNTKLNVKDRSPTITPTFNSTNVSTISLTFS